MPFRHTCTRPFACSEHLVETAIAWNVHRLARRRIEPKSAIRLIMTQPSNSRSPSPLEKLSPIAQWAVLIAGSVLFAALFMAVHLPAALLLGPMVAGIVVGSNGGRI